MKIRTISVTEFKKHCTRILRELPQSGEAILITSRNRPVARVLAVRERAKHPAWGALAGHLLSIADDFDEPMGDTDWEATH